MPFVLIFAGLVLVVSAILGTHAKLGALIVDDFTGENNFVYWILAMVLIGSIGYIPKAKPFSVAFLALVILVMFLTRGKGVGGGFFQQFTTQLKISTGGSTVSRLPIETIPSFKLPHF
jgi:hypothetical protein